jgi:hypothetical protein
LAIDGIKKKRIEFNMDSVDKKLSQNKQNWLHHVRGMEDIGHTKQLSYYL